MEEALTDHDNNLHSLMRRCRKQNMKLHQDKVNLRPKEVLFMGHLSSENGLQADPGKGRAVLEMPTPKSVYLLYNGSQEVASTVESIKMAYIRLKPSTLQEIKDHTKKGNSLPIKVIEVCWPETKGELSHLVLPFFEVRDQLSFYNGIDIKRRGSSGP